MKKQIFSLSLAGVLVFLLAACGAVAGGGGGAPTAVADQQSAAAFLPTINGYTVTGANSISDAITAAAGEGAAQFGNPAIEAAINGVDNFIQCYEDAGAVAANIYTQVDLESVLGGDVVPKAGAVAVVNQDRIRENLISCVTGGGQTNDLSSAQSVSICNGSGSFSSGGDTFTYVYVGTQQEFCTAALNHFNQYGR